VGISVHHKIFRLPLNSDYGGEKLGHGWRRKKKMTSPKNVAGLRHKCDDQRIWKMILIVNPFL
jgi:hypothetical protein